MSDDPLDESTGPPMETPPGDGPGFSEAGGFPVWSGRDLVGIVIVLFIALFLADSCEFRFRHISGRCARAGVGPAGCGSGAGRRLSSDGMVHRQSDQAASSQPFFTGDSLAISRRMAEVSFGRHDSGHSDPGALGETADSETDADRPVFPIYRRGLDDGWVWHAGGAVLRGIVLPRAVVSDGVAPPGNVRRRSVHGWFICAHSCLATGARVGGHDHAFRGWRRAHDGKNSGALFGGFGLGAHRL